MCMICSAAPAADPLAALDQHVIAAATGTAPSLPDGSVEDFARQLTHGFWEARDRDWRAFNVGTDGALTVNLTGLTEPAQAVARAALDAWASVTGILFVETAGRAEITFDDASYGAWGYSFVSGNRIAYSLVNVAMDFHDVPVGASPEWFLTFLHEIGHALGLGHSGNYNGSAVKSQAVYGNDSWAMSVMSYFDQTHVNGSRAIPLTPMLADVMAIRALYGQVAVHGGDTVYAPSLQGSAAGSDLQIRAASDITMPFAMTIIDSGGEDEIDLSDQADDQVLRLGEGRLSDVGGLRGNLAIAAGTQIEHAVTGAGHDRVEGNALGNRLRGGAGNDTLQGDAGDDTLAGGEGSDSLDGGEGHDMACWSGSTIAILVDLATGLARRGAAGDVLSGIEGLRGGTGADTLRGDTGANRLDGGEGADRLIGGDGDDTLSGDAGADLLKGGLGDDLLLATAGDTVIGGGGFDMVDLGGATEGAVLGLAPGAATSGAASGLILTGVEGVTGTAFADHLTGDARRNVLRGGNGDDTLEGGAGNDTLRGDAGADVFVFRPASGVDRIDDFTVGEDRLVLSADLFPAGAGSVADVASVSAEGLLLALGPGSSLLLAGLTDATALPDWIDWL